MKKIMIISLILLILTGCNNHEEVLSTCTLKDYKSKSTYQIIGKDKKVQKVKIKQEIKSDSKKELKNITNSMEQTYKQANSLYGGYVIKTNNEKNKVILNITIDYKKLNMKKYIKDNPFMEKYTTKKLELTLDGIVSIYEQMGATCK